MGKAKEYRRNSLKTSGNFEGYEGVKVTFVEVLAFEVFSAEDGFKKAYCFQTLWV